MAMIQGIDAGTLISAYRQGQSDRAAQQKMQMDRARQGQVQSLLGQLYGGDQQPTIADQAMQQPVMSQPQTFEQAFNTEGLASAGQPASPQVASATAQAPSRQPNPNVLKQLIVLDPEMGGKIATAFKTMSETDLKQAEAKNTMMAAAAHALARLPQAQRGQYLQSIASQLQGVGFTPQELSSADLSDNGLHMLQATGIDVDKMIDNELAEREFNAGKVVSVAPGGMAVRIRPEGNNEVVIAPRDAQPGQTAQTNATAPQAAIDYLRKNPSLAQQFDQKYGAGASAQFLGGGVSNDTGGFQEGQ